MPCETLFLHSVHCHQSPYDTRSTYPYSLISCHSISLSRISTLLH
uniref:Uncharacterized protein n=1 Tax=Siphoviridae sp. ctTBR23 TaxID=2825515 RepID=A0A8S5P120_9CAUD|nr:MAG TPA: hypothetical protein [Siphoviridae sp. ctTBR23]